MGTHIGSDKNRAAEGHHIGEKGHLAQLGQPCDGTRPGKPGEAGAVADDVRLQGAVNHGPEVGSKFLDYCDYPQTNRNLSSSWLQLRFSRSPS